MSVSLPARLLGEALADPSTRSLPAPEWREQCSRQRNNMYEGPEVSILFLFGELRGQQGWSTQGRGEREK